jgi:pyruvate dehydrogenase E2 component (dihydrolipoamide acetyltransferase)
MDEVVLMPRLSDTMTEGVIAGWQKKVGDQVKKGEILADIETDKATMELESYKDGILLYQGAKTGEKILVNDLLCIIGQQGLAIDPIVAALKGNAGAAPIATTPEAAKAADESGKETKVPSMPEPVAPSSFTVGVTDLRFNPTNAVFGRSLHTPDGHVVTLAYWNQEDAVSDDTIPYFEHTSKI